MARICLIADIDQIHTRRWIGYFLDRNQVVLINYREKAKSRKWYQEFINHYENNKNIKIIHLPLKKFNLIGYVKFLRELPGIIKNNRLEIIYILSANIAAFLASFERKIPMVVFPWGSDVLIDAKKNPFYSYMAKRVMRNADLVTPNSGYVGKMCVELGASKERIHVIQQGIDLSVFKPGIDVKDIREKYNIAPDELVVLSARNIRPLYNIDTIVMSVPLVVKKIPAVKFLIMTGLWGIGTKARERNIARLRALISELGVEKNVIIVEPVERTKMPKMLSLADIVLSVPSSDSSPAFLLEAMACGAAPVVSDLPAIKEMFKDNVNAYVVPPKNYDKLAKATIDLLNDEDKRKKFVNYNLKLVKEKANITKNVQEVEELFDKLIKGTIK